MKWMRGPEVNRAVGCPPGIEIVALARQAGDRMTQDGLRLVGEAPDLNGIGPVARDHSSVGPLVAAAAVAA